MIHRAQHIDVAHDSALAASLAETAVQALIDEAELTPKPALVDGRGCGVHPDMSLATLRRSAVALGPFFHDMALASLDCQRSSRRHLGARANGRRRIDAQKRRPLRGRGDGG
jgi:triphosphoribosyl-dephospho-CoA synthase